MSDNTLFNRWFAEVAKTALRMKELEEEMESIVVGDWPDWFENEHEMRFSVIACSADVLFRDMLDACKELNVERRVARVEMVERMAKKGDNK